MASEEDLLAHLSKLKAVDNSKKKSRLIRAALASPARAHAAGNSAGAAPPASPPQTAGLRRDPIQLEL